MRLRVLPLPGTLNADGVQPYLLVLDDGNRTVSLDEIDELPARPDLGGCQGLVAFGYRVDELGSETQP